MSRVRSVAGTTRRSLGVGWEFASAPAGSSPDGLAGLDWRPSCVPNTAAGALRDMDAWNWESGIDFDATDWWWRLRLAGMDDVKGPCVLGFDGLATLADAWFDGVHVLASDNMHVAHEVPVVLSGTHELLIRFSALAPELAKKRPRPHWRVPMIPQQHLRWFRTSLLGRTPGWSPACPAVGPWRPVWIEKVGLEVGGSDLRSRVEGDAGIVDLAIELGDDVSAVRLHVERDGDRVGSDMQWRDGRWRGSATVASAALWWPHTHGEPARYQVMAEVLHGDAKVTVDLGHIGFRTIAIEREGGDFSLCVNGVEVFCRGACWTPLDVVTLSASAEDYVNAIVQLREAGMNMVRVSGTMVYEDDAFLDALDEQGVLLWQDLMFANMDYPDDEAFLDGVLREVDQQLARLQSRPSLALVCGNSEVEQQAAMSGCASELWAPRLFHDILAERVRSHGIAYVPSSSHGGAFPHAANAGTSSYYGVGAYRRPMDDARRSELVFASECLAFANIPEERGMPGGSALRVHQHQWKSRSPRDLGAGWDFDDVRDHYVDQLFGIDCTRLRAYDHDRYLALGRFASGEIMARAFAEWRRGHSPTRGALIWFLRDLWPGAGWGIVDAHGRPKQCFHALRRVLAPTAIAFSDEGVNGLALHLFNDGPLALDARIEITAYRSGEVRVDGGCRDVAVPARAALEIAASTLFDGWPDLSFAYRFGPPLADVLHAQLHTSDGVIADAFWFPAGLGSSLELDVGLFAKARQGAADNECIVEVGARRFAQAVTIEARGWIANDGGFHLAPGQIREVVLRAGGEPCATTMRGAVRALNSETVARFSWQ